MERQRYAPADGVRWGDAEVVESREAAEHYVGLVCFKIGPPRLVGVELEWLVHDVREPAALIDGERLAAALGSFAPRSLAHPPEALSRPPLLPRGSSVTVEPGGQVEVSSRPYEDVAGCLADTAADARMVHDRLGEAGLVASGHGIDPHRAPRRILHLPRYDAMQAYFDRAGSCGRTMMCSTAAVQVNLDAGTESGASAVAARWAALHALGPVLVAMFANSPVHAGSPTGWRSYRQAVWLGTDPARTAPPGGGEADDPRVAYARYALDAPLLCVRREGGSWAAPVGVTFADWLAGALPERPTYGDLAYHLGTLFPPVRAQGHFEVRYIDAQPGGGWMVPAVVLWLLTTRAAVLEAALAAAEPVRGRWRLAARAGLADRAIAAAARALMTAVLECGPGLAVERFAERYTLRGRSPADDWPPGRPGWPDIAQAAPVADRRTGAPAPL